ncbi:MAG: tetratricopeptide repeat protein [Pirellulales bacterium]|nr:tetratricopeptide repeat protein [Pirellulales bacterium]
MHCEFSRVVATLFLSFTCGLSLPANLIAQDKQDQEKGEAALQKATEAKLSAQSLTDLGEVVKHCEEALKAGLRDDDKEFCESLLSSTLLERARGISQAILASIPQSQDQMQRMAQLREIAINDLKRSIELDANLAESHYRLGRLYAMTQGDLENAKKELDKALEMEFDDPAMKAQAFIARAAVADDAEQKQKDYDAAVKILPNNAQVLSLRAQHYLDEGNYEKALADADAAVEQEGAAPAVHEVRGRALVNLNRLEEAVKAYTTAIEMQPAAPLALLQRANIYIMLQQGEKAIDDINRTMGFVGPSPQVLAMRATAYLQTENKEKALEDIRQAMNRIENPGQGDATTFLRLGLLLASAGQNSEAIEVFNKVLEADANNVMAIEARADTYLNVGDHKSAIPDYNRALSLDPESDHVLNNLAWVLSTSPDDELRDGKRAIELATKAAELTEFKEAHILSTLAAGYAEVGEFEKAKEWSAKAVEKAEDDETRANLQAELDSYEKGKPWRERQGEDRATVNGGSG